MQITDLLTQIGGLQSMARELGVDERQAAAGADALLPAILGGLKRQAQPGGAEGLGGLLGQLGGGRLVDDVLSPQPTNVGLGNDVLGQIFGSKEVSRTVAANAASHTGLDASLLKKMLPMLAMLVTGLMAKGQDTGGPIGARSAPAGGVLGDLLGGLLGAGAGRAGGAAPSSVGGGGLMDMLDLNGDGNPLDDILNMVQGGRR
jgi:hypothetical protein